MTTQISQNQLVTLVASIGICNLMELEKLIPQNSRMCGQVRRMQGCITNIAALVGGKLDDEWLDAGVAASNAAMGVVKQTLHESHWKSKVIRGANGRFQRAEVTQ